MLDALFELDKFVSILPVFGSAKASDVLMLTKGIELYKAAFRLDIAVRFGAELKNVPFQAFPRLTNITLKDDLDNEYGHSPSFGGGGGMGEWRFNFNFTPAINREATRLNLEIPSIEFQEATRGSGMLNSKVQLNGPWQFELALPPR